MGCHPDPFSVHIDLDGVEGCFAVFELEVGVIGRTLCRGGRGYEQTACRDRTQVDATVDFALKLSVLHGCELSLICIVV